VFDVAPDAPRLKSSRLSSALQGEGLWSANGQRGGKERRRGKFAGFKPDWKKAYVRLKAGEKLPEYVSNL